MRLCTVCKREQPIELFEANQRGTHRHQCKSCRRAYHRAAKAERRKDPEWYALHLKRQKKSMYGITPAEYDAMLLSQGGRCAICGSSDSGTRGRQMSVDHDHKTGRVRSFLCTKCNVMIGCAREDPQILASAIRYLEQHGGYPAVDVTVEV